MNGLGYRSHFIIVPIWEHWAVYMINDKKSRTFLLCLKNVYRSYWIYLFVIKWVQLYQKANPDSKMTHLEFRRYVTQVLVKSNCENQVKKSVVIAVPPKEVRLDGVGHFVETTSQGRCCVCKKNTRKVCVKCKKRLHSDRQTNCFYEYHNNSHIWGQKIWYFLFYLL